jgi:hypothetical protein
VSCSAHGGHGSCTFHPLPPPGTSRGRSARRVRLAALALALIALLALPAVSSADTTVLDFETGAVNDTPISTQYQTTNFTYFQKSDGFRPYWETVAAGRAHSGTTVADIGPDHCFQETGGSCEFVTGGATARFTRTAQSVTVYTGWLAAVSPNVALKLTAFRANNTQAGTTTSPVLTSQNITTPVTVTSAAADIEHVRMDIVSTNNSSSNVGADLAIDDLTLTYPTNSLPELAVSAPVGPFAVLQGQSTDVPVTLNRLNGSSGNVNLTASGLPSGVTASFSPNPVPGTGTTATMHLSATSIAPPVFNPVNVTVTADPGGNAAVGSGPSTASTLVRVGSDFSLRAPSSNGLVPACGSVDIPFTLSRDQAFSGTVTLSLSGVPANVTAQILPGTTIAPGGNFDVAGTVRLSGGTSFISPATITLHANAPGAPERTLDLVIGRGQTKATVDQTTGRPPRYLLHGTYVHVTADGICPGTQYRMGSSGNQPATVDPDGRGFWFTVPHGAATGTVTIVPPTGTGPLAATSNSITIVPFSSTEGFPFNNYAFGNLSFGELVDEYGDNLFIHVNPCIVVDCTINTYVPDPTVLVVWPALDLLLRRSGGHCFGISRGIQELLNGDTHLTQFNSHGTVIHDLGSSTGPGSSLGDWLDSKHSAQGSAEFLYAWATRDRNLQTQFNRAKTELGLGRSPMVSLQEGSLLSGEGHAVLAYDVQDVPDGHDILVYDNNAHDGADRTQRIHISAGWNSWSFVNADGSTWSGGDGTLFVVRHSDIPVTPTLPGIGSLVEGLTTVFGSGGGAAHTTSIAPGEQMLPVLDNHAVLGSTGMFVAPRGKLQATHTITGVKNGSYDETVIGSGFAASVQHVATGNHVVDHVGGSGRAHSITFASGKTRSLAVILGDHGKTMSYGATIATHVQGGRTDSAALSPSGTLAYVHAGAPTPVSFTLTSVRRGGGVKSFVSAPVLVAGGAHVSASLAGDGQARLVLVNHGRRTVRTLHSRRRPAARIRLGAVKLASGRLRVAVRIDRLAGAAGLGAGVRVTRGRTRIAQHGVSVPKLRAGARTLTFTLPRLSRGTYSVLLQIEVLTGSPVRSATITRRVTIRLR